MFVALDATYLVDPHPSGIAVYSRELLDGLARSHPADQFLHLYRLKQYRRAEASSFSNVQRRLLLPPLPPAVWPKPELFHSLNQRVDRRCAHKVVTTYHDLFVMTGEYSSREFRERFSRQARDAARRSDLLIAVSAFTMNQIMTLLHVEAERIRVVPHGVHMPASLPPFEERQNMILCVGALQKRKNVVRLVEAFESLPDRAVMGWSLVLAGSTAGFGAAEILSRIEDSSRSKQIKLRGYVTSAELNQLYQQASVFAFPSLDEGFGIPVLEAMAHGIPVLTSSRSALPEVAGEAALLADPSDVAALSAALLRLIEDGPLRRQLSQSGLQRASQFPWTNVVQRTFDIYRELLS